VHRSMMPSLISWNAWETSRDLYHTDDDRSILLKKRSNCTENTSVHLRGLCVLERFMKKPLGERTEAVWDPCGFRTPAAQLDVTLLCLSLFRPINAHTDKYASQAKRRASPKGPYPPRCPPRHSLRLFHPENIAMYGHGLYVQWVENRSERLSA